MCPKLGLLAVRLMRRPVRDLGEYRKQLLVTQAERNDFIQAEGCHCSLKSKGLLSVRSYSVSTKNSLSICLL